MKRRTAPTTAAQVNVRRVYLESRYGQLHVRTAFPSTGGFDEGTPLVCLHAGPVSSRMFAGLLADLGRERSIYAPDLPGCGESDAPATPLALADYVAAIGDLLDTLRLRQIDVLGQGAGAVLALELALARPEQVRRAVVLSLSGATRAAQAALPAAPPVPPLAADGSHLAPVWQSAAEAGGARRSLEQLAVDVAERLRNGPRVGWLDHAVGRWDARSRLPLVKQPVLWLRPHDRAAEQAPTLASLLPQHQLVDLPDQDASILDVAPAAVATRARAFYDAV